jgi:hypothetical protein
VKCDAIDGLDGDTTIQWGEGTYVLVQSIKPPDHYETADTLVTIVGEDTTEVTVANEIYPLLTITKVNESGVILPGACFRLFNDNGDGTPGSVVNGANIWCDDEVPNDAIPGDGIVTKRYPAGNYIGRELTAPTNYAKATDFGFMLSRNADLNLYLPNQLAGTVLVTTVDETEGTLNNACYELWTISETGGPGVLYVKACDLEPTQPGSVTDGVVKLEGLLPRDYILRESIAPFGYGRAADQTIAVVGGETLEITVENHRV